MCKILAAMPQDLFALIKLFQTPSRSTLNSVDNLGVRFHELIAKYNKLEKEGKKNLTVLTNSLKIAYELMSEREITVLLLGGKVRYGEGTTSGYWAENMIDGFYEEYDFAKEKDTVRYEISKRKILQ